MTAVPDRCQWLTAVWGQVRIRVVPSAPPTEAVRIFVHFTEQVPNPTCTSLPSSNVRLLMACIGRQAAATKAKIDLDGRFFGGRQVWVGFYSEPDFEKGALTLNP